MSYAEEMIERQLDRELRVGDMSKSNVAAFVDVRGILDYLSTYELQKLACAMYRDGKRTEPDYEKMNVSIMNREHGITDRQRYALTTFVMFAK